MQHFHSITPIILLFHESRPEKTVNHTIHHINRWEYLIIFSDIMFCFAVYCFSSVKVSLRERLKESNSKESIDFRVRTEWWFVGGVYT